MLETSSPLAAQAAELRRTAQAVPAPLWLPDALHAMIMACLVRIFARLEDLIALWQSGQLPACAAPAHNPAPAPAREATCPARHMAPELHRRARSTARPLHADFPCQAHAPLHAQPPLAAWSSPPVRTHGHKPATPHPHRTPLARAPPLSRPPIWCSHPLVRGGEVMSKL